MKAGVSGVPPMDGSAAGGGAGGRGSGSTSTLDGRATPKLASRMQPTSPPCSTSACRWLAARPWRSARTRSSTSPGPMGAGGKSTGTAKYEWMDGKYFMVSQSSHSGVMGEGVETAYYGYDANKKVYTYDSFSSMGEHNIATATIDVTTGT